MASKSNLAEALGLKFPLIVAPMAGGPSSTALVIAASEAGAVGSIGAAYLNANEIARITESVQAGTSRPFGINLFIPAKVTEVSKSQLDLAIAVSQKYRDEFNISAPSLKPPFQEDFDEQFEAVLRLKPKIFSFIFGVLAPEYMRSARRCGLFLVGTATSLDEALTLEESGVDAIVVQGVEAGGHRGIFDADRNDPAIATIDLVRNVKERVRAPIIAAGGIMTSRHVREMIQAGADGVQMGTAFLATREAGTSLPYRTKLLENSTRATKTSRAFSGRLARGLVNRFMREMDEQPEAILPFPAQNKFTRDLRSASAAANSSDYLSLWAGSGEGELWTGSTAELIHRLFA